jgi:hypothetical protein
MNIDILTGQQTGVSKYSYQVCTSGHPSVCSDTVFANDDNGIKTECKPYETFTVTLNEIIGGSSEISRHVP